MEGNVRVCKVGTITQRLGGLDDEAIAGVDKFLAGERAAAPRVAALAATGNSALDMVVRRARRKREPKPLRRVAVVIVHGQRGLASDSLLGAVGRAGRVHGGMSLGLRGHCGRGGARLSVGVGRGGMGRAWLRVANEGQVWSR